jgi:hypothetical protein
MKRNRMTPLVFGEIFLQPILLDWWLKNTQNSLKLSQTQINKKAGFRIIPNSRKGIFGEFVFLKSTFTRYAF